MGSFVIRMSILLFLFICIGYTTASLQQKPNCDLGEVFYEKEQRCVSCELCVNFVDEYLPFCDECDFGKEDYNPCDTFFYKYSTNVLR